MSFVSIISPVVYNFAENIFAATFFTDRGKKTRKNRKFRTRDNFVPHGMYNILIRLRPCFCRDELNSGIRFDKSTAEARRLNQTFELSSAVLHDSNVVLLSGQT